MLLCLLRRVGFEWRHRDTDTPLLSSTKEEFCSCRKELKERQSIVEVEKTGREGESDVNRGRALS